MAITNGYATLAEYKAYARITSTDATDDAVLEDIIEGASRLIDQKTRRTFYSRTTETRYADVPDSSTLMLDDDLISITTLTNGDSTVITSSDYILLPANYSPKYAIQIKETSSITWEATTAGNTKQVITILGSWGFAAAAPDDIKQACLMIAVSEYHRRFGENVAGAARITAAGVVITPQGIPPGAAEILQRYERQV